MVRGVFGMLLLLPGHTVSSCISFVGVSGDDVTRTKVFMTYIHNDI